MEGRKSACKQGKKKTAVSIGVFNGGGIGGVVGLGGALAAAAVIAFLANKRNKGRRPTKKDLSKASDSSKKFNLKNKNNTDEEIEGLQFVVQPSPPSVHHNQCCKSNGTSEMGAAQIGQNDLISTQNSILEAISVPEINGGKEALKNGDHDESFVTNPENISLCKDNVIDNEEYTLPVLEISSVLEEEVNKINDAGEEPPLLEAIEEAEKEEEAFEIVLVEQLEGDLNNINDAGEEPPLVEAIEEVKKEEEASEIVHVEQLEENANKINDAGEEPPLLEAIEEAKKGEEASEIVLVEQLEEDVNKINDAGEEPPLPEAIEKGEKEEEASSETVIAEDVGENPPMKSVEEEEEQYDDHDDEDELEKSEEGSEETGDSSMESNAEAIWPTESIEKLSLSLALKEMNFNYQNSGEKIDEEDKTVKHDSSNKDNSSLYENGNEDESTRKSMVISDNKETFKLLTVNDQAVRSGNLRMFILSILGTVLLLLMLGFLTHHSALFSYLVNGDSVL